MTMATKALNPNALEFSPTNNQACNGHMQHTHPPPPPPPLIVLPPLLAPPHNLLPDQECYYTTPPVSNYHCTTLPYYYNATSSQPLMIPHYFASSDQFPNNNSTGHAMCNNWPGQEKQQIMGNEATFVSERLINGSTNKVVVHGDDMHRGTRSYSPRTREKHACQFTGGSVKSPPISPTTPLARGGGPVGGAARTSAQHRSSHLGCGKTTVMIRNIPNQLGRDDMLEFLDRYCRDFKLEYDFVYLPMDFMTKGNFGYAFVNFTNPSFARTIMSVLHRYKWGLTTTLNGESFYSIKICQVDWARIQGKDDLVRKFQDANFLCKETDFLPVVFYSPRNGSEPKPSPVVLGQLKPEFYGCY